MRRGLRWALRECTLEKHLYEAIARDLRAVGCDVTRLAQPRRTMQTAGIPDLYVRHVGWGLRLWLEVKRPGVHPTDGQTAWHATERACGGSVAVVRSSLEALAALEAAGARIHTGDRHAP